MSKSAQKLSDKIDELQANVKENSPQDVTYLYMHSTPTSMRWDRPALGRPQLLEQASNSMKRHDLMHVEAADLAALLSRSTEPCRGRGEHRNGWVYLVC